MKSVFFASAVLLGTTLSAHAGELTLMTFNTHGLGITEKRSLSESVAAIKAVNPDIIGIQETRAEPDPCTPQSCLPVGPSRAKELAAALGYHLYEQTKVNDALWANAILSRYPIGETTPNDTGVKIDVNGTAIWAFNVHFPDAPYQPYQALGIEYGPWPFLKTGPELEQAAHATRDKGLAALEADVKTVDGAAVSVLFGDFNEPSFHDWTEATVKAGLQPLVVAYPTTKTIESWGFVDAVRAIFPDPVAKPAFTWTPSTEPTDKDDHHDRIDFVFARGKTVKIIAAGIVGEKTPEADIVVTPWPSDHRAAFAKITY